MGNSNGSSSDTSSEPFKVLFCGEGQAESTSCDLTRQALKGHVNITVTTCTQEKLREAIVDADVVIPLACKIGKNLIEHAPRLQMIMQYGAGLDSVNVSAATRAGVWVCRVAESSGNAQSSAEHCIYLALSLLRNQKKRVAAISADSVDAPLGRSLMGSVALIYGFGGVGTQLLKRLIAFDLRNIYVVRRSSHLKNINIDLPQNISSGSVEIGDENCFEQFAPHCDVVFMCCSPNDSNNGLVNKEFLSKMKTNAILVSVAKGGVLDYDDVLASITEGHLAGVGLDEYMTEPLPKETFLKHPQVLCTPHVGVATDVSSNNIAAKVADNIKRVMLGKIPRSAVNEVIMPDIPS